MGVEDTFSYYKTLTTPDSEDRSIRFFLIFNWENILSILFVGLKVIVHKNRVIYPSVLIN